MNRTLSAQQIRLAVLLGLVAIIAVGWFVVVKPGSHQATSTPPVTHATSTPATHSTIPAHPAPAHTTPAPIVTAPSIPVTKPHVAQAKPHAVKTVTRVTRPGYSFPPAVRQALAKHRIVVVSLYTPGVVVDKLTRAESAAGAKAAGAGFVALDVNDQKQVNPLLTMLGPLDSPAVLVVRRCCGWTFATFEGFVDRATLEQAVADARR